MVTPAEGPSFGIAPAGTWICRSVSFNRSSSSPSVIAFDRTHVSAACILSFITSPICPVIVKPPLPFILFASIKSTSPPAGVPRQANRNARTLRPLRDLRIHANLDPAQELVHHPPE